jgi:hypothetical protein
MYTPETRAKRSLHQRVSGPQRISLSSGSELQYTAEEIVESLGYYLDNSITMDIPLDSSQASRRIAWESTSSWRLLLELYRADALAERFSDQMFTDEVNPLRDAFLAFPSFRRLLGLLRWAHWINHEERRLHQKEQELPPSMKAYPHSGNGNFEMPLDSVLNQPELINMKDVDRERILCKDLWGLLSEGRINEAVEKSIASGHRWRAGVLNSGCGHEMLREGGLPDDEISDWVESCILAGHRGLQSGTDEESLHARYTVKKTAKAILSSSKCLHGLDEFDIAMIAYLCGSEHQLRKVSAGRTSFGLNLWISLHTLKEEFAAFILGKSFMVTDRLQGVKSHEIDTILGDNIKLILSSLETTLDLAAENPFHQLHVDLIVGNYTGVLEALHGWISGGIISFHGIEYDIDIRSPAVDEIAAILVRSFAGSLVTNLRSFIAPHHKFDKSIVSRILIANLEAVVAQLEKTDSLLTGNQLVAEHLSLLGEDTGILRDCWAWYLEQIRANSWPGWTLENATSFAPILSLIETFPSESISVIQRLIRDSIEAHVDVILAGSNVHASKEIGFALGCANSLWLTTENVAKSTGNGIYLDVNGQPDVEDPEVAATRIVKQISNLVGEGLLALLLSGLTATEELVAIIQSTPSGGHKLTSLFEAVESVEESDEGLNILEIAITFAKICQRVELLFKHNSLVEQQRANLSALNGRIGVGSATEVRRQIAETQRMIETSSASIRKLADEIVEAMSEFLQAAHSPINPDQSHIGLETGTMRSITKASIENVVELCVEALALVDDRKRQQVLEDNIRGSVWLNRLISQKRIDEILQELA